MLLSWATWAALFEMMGRPHSWTKTEHGLAKQRLSQGWADAGPREPTDP